MNVFSCEACRRPISHRGFCLPCNMKRKNEPQTTAKPGRSETRCKCGFRAMYNFLRCPECDSLQDVKKDADEVETASIEPAMQIPAHISFPFQSMRAPQKELIDDIENAVENKRHLVAHAPAGLGKTIASLYPAVRYAAESGKTVIFLTSRLSQHRMAIETMQRLGLPAVDIIGKKHLCSHDVQYLDSSMFANFCHALVSRKQCEFYRNFRQKEITDGARRMILELGKKPMHSEDAKKLAGAKFCTYELLMEAAKTAPVIVGDYFHVFSPNEKAFFRRIGKTLDNCIIIVDEAHNLPRRIRDSMSSKVSTRTLELAKKEDTDFRLGLKEQLDCIEKAIISIAKKKLLTASESFVIKEELSDKIEASFAYNSLVMSLAKASEQVLKKKKRSFIERIAVFLDSWKGGDYGYARILSRERIYGRDRISVYYNCMDPSFVSKPVISQSHSTILMSGTLLPTEMYRDLLGLEQERTDMKSYASPFPKNNMANLILPDVTTAYKERTENNYRCIAEKVVLCVAAIRGNVAVFFPSYEILKYIYQMAKSTIEKPVLLEEQGMGKQERKQLQDEFASLYEKGAVLFGVISGSFSEGIDLPGDKLNGVLVVGLPLEKPNLSVKALIDYYDERFKRGREYGYVYPAMIKVMQAAGRCIRTETDIGVCVFGDKRFLWKSYNSIFPKDWDFVTSATPEAEIKKFFDSH